MRLTDYTHVFIDFDETLFCHESYIEWLAKYLKKVYGVDTTEFLASFDDYHDVQDSDGLLRLYRHEQHLLEKTGLAWDMLSGEIEAVIRSESKDFCYPEVHESIEAISVNKNTGIRLLTYGDGAYQRFKINLCPHMQKIPIHVVGEAKSNFLAKHYSDAGIQGVLIDDKAPLIMPSNWQHVWVNRNGRAKPGQSECIEIQDLSGLARRK